MAEASVKGTDIELPPLPKLKRSSDGWYLAEASVLVPKDGTSNLKFTGGWKLGLKHLESASVAIVSLPGTIALTVPPGLAIYPHIAFAGGPIAIGDGHPVAPDRFQITLTDDAAPEGDLDQFMQSELLGFSVVSRRAAKVNQIMAKQITYRDSFGDAANPLTTYLTYFTRNGRLFKFFLSFSSSTRREHELKKDYDDVLSSIVVSE